MSWDEAAPFVAALGLTVLSWGSARALRDRFRSDAASWLHPQAPTSSAAAGAIGQATSTPQEVVSTTSLDTQGSIALPPAAALTVGDDQDAVEYREQRLLRYADFWADMTGAMGSIGPPVVGILADLKGDERVVLWAYTAAVVLPFVVALYAAHRGPEWYGRRLRVTPVMGSVLVVNAAGVAIVAMT